MVFTIVALLITLNQAPADVAGRWEGTLSADRQDGTTHEEPLLIILEQKGTVLTGTVGRDDADRHPIVKGAIEGAAITLVARRTGDGREVHVELTVKGNEMSGTASFGEQRAKLALTRKAAG